MVFCLEGAKKKVLVKEKRNDIEASTTGAPRKKGKMDEGNGEERICKEEMMEQGLARKTHLRFSNAFLKKFKETHHRHAGRDANLSYM